MLCVGGLAKSIANVSGLGENQFATGGIAVAAFAALIASAKVAADFAVDLLAKKIIVKAEFDSRDESYSWILNWLSENMYSKNCNHFAVTTRISSRPGEGQDDLVDGQKAIYFLPSPGVHFFWFRGRPLWLSRERISQANLTTGSVPERITISTFGRRNDVLKRLTYEAQKLYVMKDHARTIIYAADQYGTWRRSRSLPKRELESIILNEDVKEGLVSDAEEFLRNEKWYAGLGIPYRRGYLLYGPPGTGKTSFVTALAGHLNLNIYNINLSNKALTDSTLTELLIDLPPRCVLLLEDIHTLFPNVSAKPSSEIMPSNPNLTFAGILNVIDGVIATEGRLLFLTTNRVELDKALIRPGRVDVKSYFGNATKSTTKAIFVRFYQQLASKEVSKVSGSFNLRMLEELAEEFTQGIDEGRFSPAMIIGYLMKHKSSPQDAVKNMSLLEDMDKIRAIED
ncbi:P-loop containing nucleoside triphosphate hydrolase protein [Paraphysoderma sedebokerense]|nr:P-loop containing nucleoside triphosphate hydrolase protein [Paraphysoderma sedebokerense]